MKAGAFTPAIPIYDLLRKHLLGRSMKAGAFTPAIPESPGGHPAAVWDAQ